MICGGALAGAGTRYDDRYASPGEYQLLRCAACGHASLSAPLAPDQLRRLYTDFYPRAELDPEAHRPHREPRGIRAWLDGTRSGAWCHVPPRVRVLDIGCGSGESLGYHLARGCEAFGVEADENVRRIAERFGYRIHLGLFDPSLYPPASFDVVTLDQVLEHAADPIGTLRGVHQVLKQGGAAIVALPNPEGWAARVFGRRWIHWHAPYHLQHFTARSLRLAAERAGLVQERALARTNSEWILYQWIHALTMPPPGAPSPFWSPRARRSWRARVAIFALAQAHRTRLDHLLTRLLDAAGAGDGRLVFLRKP